MVIGGNIPFVNIQGKVQTTPGTRSAGKPVNALARAQANAVNDDAFNSHNQPKSTSGSQTNTKSIADNLKALKDMSNRIDHFNITRQQHADQAQNAKEAAAHDRKMRIAFEIAARIMRGDNVPQSDKDFLLEHSPGLFKLAMSARNHNNENPEDHDALANEEGKSFTGRPLNLQHVNLI
ncbi:MAG: hypothetical protein FWE29_06105 [Defluviitaleaceae bacterium]|nr:hypothetical protein [Defluviitaleaceae bacterium]